MRPAPPAAIGRTVSLMHLACRVHWENDREERYMTHAAAIAQLETHASNCENNAAIQEREGQHEDAANNRTNAAEYRQAIETLQAE